ncbi:UbiA family prenyltransferase [Tautonia rosea]|uniref:UbiA family prenyltransferase n=1 Tax=Tautonia rosea TaxID=2728037 RepID=UPI0014751989|nr:UbiA family prenyltransferase [Tautonia rosea]
MRLKPYFQLVRLPNVFTAAADSLSGWLLVGGLLVDADSWLPLVVASMAIYAAGIALNDVFDLELDRVERPGRPLPSGKVSKLFAVGLAVCLMAMGLMSASMVGVRPAIVAGGLITCVVAYDAGLRRTILGPELMGLCRGLNVFLGMSLAPQFGGPAAWTVAAAMTVFIVGVTWISRFETEVGRRAASASGLLLQSVGITALFGAGLSAESFPSPWTDRPSVPVLGIVILALVSSRILWASGRAVLEPRPETLQRAVKVGVLSLIWLHVGVLACVREPTSALAVAALWLPASLAARWIYST